MDVYVYVFEEFMVDIKGLKRKARGKWGVN